MNRGVYREVHLFLTANSEALLNLRFSLPDLLPNPTCDPAKTPEGSICYQYPADDARYFEITAERHGVGYQWGGGGSDFHDVALVGDYLYAVSANGNLLKIWDMSDPVIPVATGTLSLAGANCIAIYQGIAFVGGNNGALYIVNIDDPAVPTLITSTSFGTSNWEFIRVVGGLVFLTGRAASLVAIFNTDGNLFGSFPPPANPSGLDVQGRRAFFADASADNCNAYTWRIGGTYCGFATFGSVLADELWAEQVRGRDGSFIGDLRAWNLLTGGATTEEDRGVVAAPNYFIGREGVRLYTGVGDPTLTFGPQQVAYWFSDGSGTGRIFFTDDGGATWTSIA